MRLNSNGVLEHTPKINDHVVPLARVAGDKVTILGTAFLIGPRGHALTAGHCLPEDHADLKVLFFVPQLHKVAVEPIAAVERHPTEDVALLRFTTVDSWWGMLRLDSHLRMPGQEYESWGYPEITYYETVRDGLAVLRPDLVYDKGYVRRLRDDPNLPRIMGRTLYELSTRPGAGYSGSPIVAVTPGAQKSWAVIGIYLGEQGVGQRMMAELEDGRVVTKVPDTSSKVTAEFELGGSYFGYASRAADFGNWTPAILGHSLLDEANPPDQVKPLTLGPNDIID